MKNKSKLPPAALLLLIQIKKHSVRGICILKDRELSKLIDKSYSHTVLLVSRLRKSKKIKTIRVGSTKRKISIIGTSRQLRNFDIKK